MNAAIAIIGGSGFYSEKSSAYKLLNNAGEVKIKTPYGDPSDKITIGEISGRKIAFLPRHGKAHQFPPHKINYRANLWALKKLGVKKVISLTACGSLQKKIKRGDFVIVDQFIDRTYGRLSTFFDGPETVHVSTAYPYCQKLSFLAYQRAKKMGLPVHKTGTLVVIDGPRFSTRAESEWFTKMGWEIINMTGYPEAALAREAEMCYASVAVVTDYDAGVVAKEKIAPVNLEEVLETFGENIGKAKKLVESLIRALPEEDDCQCYRSLAGAKVNAES